MKLVIKLLALILVWWTIIYAQIAQAAEGTTPQGWQGTYSYCGYGGSTTGGSQIIIDTVLNIAPAGGCNITQEGFQAMTGIICSVLKNKSGIDVLFETYANGRIENEYGVILYRPKELLFSLRASENDENIVTTWGTLKPDFVKENEGIFFKRTRNGR